MSASSLPTFKELPIRKDGPPGNSWGIWREDDQLGTLNHLTAETVARAAQENILTGQRVSLNWSMTATKYPAYQRKVLKHELIDKAPEKHAHDDVWTFNSQCSSQWDGFRHYAYQKEGLYYMGRTAEEFAASEIPNGIQHVAKMGVAGRGVLIDWYKWALEHKQGEIDAFEAFEIPFSEIMKALKSQGMQLADIRPGDILVVRSGYIAQYENMAEEKRERLNEHYKTHKPSNIGLKPSEELLEFLWNSRVAAVCGDSRSFEVWPCRDLQWHLHEWLLAGWGMPIGELFDLEALAQTCTELGRYTFFLSSAPMNVLGAVASPPNALAFF